MPRLPQPIYINDYSCVSPGAVGSHSSNSYITRNGDGDNVAALSAALQQELDRLLEKHPKYNALDRSVQLALLAADGLQNVPANTAVNIGSSRGATGLWETSHEQFLNSRDQPDRERHIPVQTSPLTTLGNIASWTAQHLGLCGPALSHSITCATASHALLNSIAWLGSGMATTMLAGGSEAPLTPFTITQMKALRIYGTKNTTYPCEALNPHKKTNQMILGEGAALFLLSRDATTAHSSPEKKEKQIAIAGYGTAIESLKSATSVSSTGDGLVTSMAAAMQGISSDRIDAIVTHAPGTIKGDASEYAAIQSVFGKDHPVLLNNKWQLGHTLGASSAMNLVMAIKCIKESRRLEIPYLDKAFINPRADDRPINRVLLNATGFGGNAVSLLVEGL